MKNYYYYNRFEDRLEVGEGGYVPEAAQREDGEQSDDWSGPFRLPNLTQAEAAYRAETRGGATEARAVVRYLRETASDTEVAEAMSAAVELVSDDVATVYLADDAVFDADDEDEDRAMREQYTEFVETLGLKTSRRREGDEDEREAAHQRDGDLYEAWHALFSETDDLDAIVEQYRADNDLADGELPVGYCPQSDARRALRRFCEWKRLHGYLVVSAVETEESPNGLIIGAGWTAEDAERDADGIREGWRLDTGMGFRTKRVPAALMLAVERDGSTSELAYEAVQS